jgi:hypothetical protein
LCCSSLLLLAGMTMVREGRRRMTAIRGGDRESWRIVGLSVGVKAACRPQDAKAQRLFSARGSLSSAPPQPLSQPQFSQSSHLNRIHQEFDSSKPRLRRSSTEALITRLHLTASASICCPRALRGLHSAVRPASTRPQAYCDTTA